MDTETTSLHLATKITALDKAMQIHGVGFSGGETKCEDILMTAEKIEKYLAADIVPTSR